MLLSTKKIAMLATPFLATMLLNARSHSGKVPDVTVMGCLVQGDQPHQYVIKGDDKTYVLTASRVNLAKHVGQKVSVSGSMKDAGNGTERFKVSALSKVNKTCQ